MIDITLNGLLELVKPLLSESLKELIKGKSSDKKAKERIYKLYKGLSNVNEKTEIFINNLTRLIERTRMKSQSSEFEFRSTNDENPYLSDDDKITKSMVELLLSLDSMADALDGVNPQLEIYKYDIVKAIRHYQVMRTGIVREVEWALSIDKLRLSYFVVLKEEAIKNAGILSAAIEELRLFIASEFRFKDSF